MLDFRIDTFLAVCRSMNFTRAAVRCNQLLYAAKAFTPPTKRRISYE